MGPISKNKDSKLMQMLSPSSIIYLCGLLPNLPKSYNLLTEATRIRRTLEQCTWTIAAILLVSPLTDGSQFSMQIKGAQVVVIN